MTNLILSVNIKSTKEQKTNKKQGGTVQWDSNQNLKKLKSKNDRKEVRTNGTVSGIRRDQKES